MVRPFKTPYTRPQLGAYFKGVMQYHYRDVMCNKSPLDIALFLHLINAVKPATYIEIGTKHGGSALLMRDIAKMYDLDMKVVSIDRSPPEVDSRFDGIQFVKGNVLFMESTWAENNLYDLPRPWLICEDSAHTYTACMGVLKFFEKHLRAGEYLVMEDAILEELGLGDKFEGGPSRALAEYLDNNPGIYEIDTTYCDMFGVNATTNPNGYLRKL